MRGKVGYAGKNHVESGITPAYAGKSPTTSRSFSLSRDHPRLCGEKFKRFLVKCFILGSPPPMRGKEKAASYCAKRFGITPAYAGKRFAKQYRRSIDWDPPRLCGEKKQRTGRCAGSIRITPAYAGKSIFDCVISTCKMGSPPPMRGKVTVIPSRACTCRITPAYAGKRLHFWYSKGPRKDHPRLCGEKMSHALFIMLAMGSPPPMRGKVNCFVVIVQPRRITPAYAGKRWFRSPSSFALGDHPRLCGEK